MFDMFKEIVSNLNKETKENLLNALKPFIKELESQYDKQRDKDSFIAISLKMIIKTANELYVFLDR